MIDKSESVNWPNVWRILGADHLTFEGVMGDFRNKCPAGWFREEKSMEINSWEKNILHWKKYHLTPRPCCISYRQNSYFLFLAGSFVINNLQHLKFWIIICHWFYLGFCYKWHELNYSSLQLLYFQNCRLRYSWNISTTQKHCITIPHSIDIRIELIQFDNSALNIDFQT